MSLPRKPLSTIRIALILLLIVVLPSAMVWAGCKSDCRDTYESEIESCKLLHDGPDDADDLQLCIQVAKDDYDSCVEECDN